ncbi:MAG: AsmA family protein, partial [Rhizobiaceae bacterium]|nr:AsmA family protein [Rhizobiaceae bacterium]
MARLFVLIGGLIVLALCVALIGPYFIDWTSYRADFEREASAVLGRKVTVEGTASARLLPFPSVTFTDVVVGGTSGQPAMTVETFSMDAELAPFLRGEVLIFDMRLVRPKARIEVKADGSVDWLVRPSTPFDPRQISLEKATITDGSVEIDHAGSGRTHSFTEINGTVSARTFAGPWRADGTLRFDGLPAKVSASTGALEESGAMRLRTTVKPDHHPLVIETDGNIQLKDGAPTYAGSFRVNELAQQPADGTERKPEAASGTRVAGQFTLAHERLSVDEFRFETGPTDDPYTAEGTAAIEFIGAPRFSVSMKGAQVRFDEATAGKAGAGLTLGARIEALEKVLASLPRPSMPGTITVDLPAVVAGDTTVRDVSFSAEPSAAGWTLNAFTATLPGRTKLEANGELALGDTFGFKGSLLVAVAQPSGFAAWVAREVDDAIRRLPAAGFSAKVDVSRERQHFSDLELVLGDARFTGELDRRQQGDARPAVALSLSGGALDLDGLAAFTSLFVSDAGATRFADHD